MFSLYLRQAVSGVTNEISYLEPNLNSYIPTTYADYDAKWRDVNGVFKHDNVSSGVIQELDLAAIDPYNTLKYDNVYGTKDRFTDPTGGSTPPSSSVDPNDGFIDHLTGRHYFVWSGGTGFRNWTITLAVRQSIGFYCISSQEWFSLISTKNPVITILGFSLPISSSMFPWTCDIDLSNTANAKRVDNNGYPRQSLAITSTSRTALFVKIWGGI